MAKILSFEKFNENWFNKLTSFFTGSKPYERHLKKYNIQKKEIDAHTLHLFHKEKLVGKIELNQDKSMSVPFWDLTIYIYESETPKRDGFIPNYEKIRGQSEQPYAVSTLTVRNTVEAAVLSFVGWWETYTKTGRKSNIRFRV